ncbi:MAG: antibiotic ABC transporter ATP-binding protein [Bacteroidetes bacterium GWE2_29_8]|nr:MAG: antibiotic ABC transporter ATP-binding protein [Bacteroidetes bacterium GWE2_29_8]
MKKFLRIVKYIKPYWGYASLNITFNILSILFSLVSLTMVIPFLGLLFGKAELVTEAPPLSFQTDSLIKNGYYFLSKIINDYGKVDALILICGLVILMFFLKNLFRYLGLFFMANIRNGVIKDLRKDIYLKITILPLSYYSEQRKGDIMSRITNDVHEVEWSIMSSLEMVFKEPIAIISFIATLTFLSPELTVFVMILLPVTGFIIGRIGKSLRKRSVKAQNKLGQLLSIIEETISGLRIIKGFNAIEYFNRKFGRLNDQYSKIMIGVYRRGDLSAPMSEFLGTLVLVIVMWFGGKLVLSSNPTVSAEVFIAYIAIFSQIIQPSKNFSTAFYNIQRGIASAERIYSVLDAEERIVEKPNAISIKSFNNKIHFNNVTFSYEKETVLKNINLEIPKGKVIAIVGQSGGGKSTLVDLLPRFYDCTYGEILIDNHSVKDFYIDDLRNLMGIVSQECILFNDTVYNNIVFGLDEAPMVDVIEAAKIANAHDFISAMENGYYTYIGDRGSKLSGGQKQRLSIARAVLRNPAILIFDEATSALDTESEKLVQDALSKIMKNRTTIIIAHRLSTIQFADEIIVIHKGEIVERGTHNELLEKSGIYQKLHNIQAFS